MNTVVNVGLTAVLAFTQITSTQLIETIPTHDTTSTAYTSTIKLSSTVEPFEIQDVSLQPIVVGTARKQIVTEQSQEQLKEYAQQLVAENFGTGHFKAFDAIVTHESNWNPKAINKSSGACGLAQTLPCSRLTDHSAEGQLQWMVTYIKERYKNPTIAWNTWQRQGWY